MADQNNLTFTDNLRQRREELFGAGDPLGLGETPEGQAVQRASEIQSERLGTALSGEDQFQQFPSEIFEAEDFFLGRAGSFLKPLIDNALRELEDDEEDAVGVGGIRLDPVTGQEIIDPETERDAQNIIAGVMDISDVKIDRRGAVARRMTQLGFDPAADINSLLNNMESLFFGGEGDDSISTAGVPISQQLQTFGLFVGKKFQTEKGQRAKLYEDTREGFTSALRDLASQSGQLNVREFEALQKLTPDTSKDTDDIARAKFAQLRGQIAAQYGGASLANTLSIGSEGQASNILGIPTANAAGAGSTGLGGVDPYKSEVSNLDY